MEEQQKEFFMKEALLEAKKAYELGEVPIGAVVVHEGKIIGRGHNLREQKQDATLHAEIQAIRMANKELNNWRLEDCELFVTVEPCPMCAGAIVLSRIKKVTYGIPDEKAGAAGTLMNILNDERLNHRSLVEGDVLADECRNIIQRFFIELRERNKEKKRQRKLQKEGSESTVEKQ